MLRDVPPAPPRRTRPSGPTPARPPHARRRSHVRLALCDRRGTSELRSGSISPVLSRAAQSRASSAAFAPVEVTGRPPGALARGASFTADGVAESAETVDLDLDRVARTQEATLGGADACRRARGDDVAGQQRHRPREPRDQLGGPEDQIRGAAFLQRLAVDTGAQRQPAQVTGLVERDERRSAPPAAARPVAPRPPPIPAL